MIKCGKGDDPQVRKWTTEYEELWGFSMQTLMSKEWRLQYSRSRLQQSDSDPTPIPLQHRNHSPFRQSTASPSVYPSLGRSLGELRLHTHNSHTDNRSHGDAHDAESQYPTNGTNFDPHQSGSSQQRNVGFVVEGPQSLPSLKASGLLDSWGSGKEGSAWGTHSHSRVDFGGGQKQGLQQLHSPPRKTSPSQYPASPQHCGHYDSDPVRTATNGMPVGMPWLANESR
jgi:hypothetical protein